jgi:hypothetical protein
LPQVGVRAERPGDGFASRGFVAGYLVIQGAGKSGLGHRSAAGHQRFELLPAQRGALPLATKQAQTGRPQKEARVRGGDHDGVAGGRRGLNLRDGYRRNADCKNQDGLHGTDCVIGTHEAASAAQSDNRIMQKSYDFK